MTQLYDYYPYGSELQNTQLTSADAKHSFTDKELDDSLGIYYFEARWYDADIGRFISQDPWEGDINNPQTLNKYTYTLNNPINIVDTTGNYPVSSQVADLYENSLIVKTASNYNTYTTKTALYAMAQEYGSSGSLNGSRYVYMETGGWVDMRHFFNAANLANSWGYDAAVLAGEMTEYFQQFSPIDSQYFSAYSFEDLTSNSIGAYFGETYLPEKMAQGYTLDEALKMYFEDLGGLSADEALADHSTIYGGTYSWQMPTGYTSEENHPKSDVSMVDEKDLNDAIQD